MRCHQSRWQPNRGRIHLRNAPKLFKQTEPALSFTDLGTTRPPSISRVTNSEIWYKSVPALQHEKKGSLLNRRCRRRQPNEY